jgi:ATP-dependent RNA helicase DeaD
MEVALAAVKLAHEASGGTPDTEDIPEVIVKAGPSHDAAERGPRRPTKAGVRGAAMTRLYVGAGRAAGVRPQDLVGAIAGESSLTGRQIGAIEIADRFSLVEVPDAAADEVIEALRRTTIKGRKWSVRRERYTPRKG